MPTSTWDGLPAAKRERILAASMAEFGRHGFSVGSLNVIAREAGIAKGSLFVYFEDKLGLFTYVCNTVSERIREVVVARMLDHGIDRPMFELLRLLAVDWVDFFRTHPVERGVTLATSFEMDPDVRAAVRGVVNRHYLEVLTPLVDTAVERGEVVGDRDRLLAFLLLLFPHLAIAPFQPEVDPVLRLDQRSDDEVVAEVQAQIDDLERAFGPA